MYIMYRCVLLDSNAVFLIVQEAVPGNAFSDSNVYAAAYEVAVPQSQTLKVSYQTKSCSLLKVRVFV